MTVSRSQKFLKSLRGSYLHQFSTTLEENDLTTIVDDELVRKKRDFLKAYLEAAGMSYAELLEIRKILEAKEFDFSREEELSEEELAKEARRAYARAYYQRKKLARFGGEEAPAKRVPKTTPAQRAYQRAYYQKKKAEKAAKKSSES